MKSKKHQGGLCPLSQTTKHLPLIFTLDKVHHYGFTNNKLDGIYRLHICRQTLSNIEKGQLPAGKEQHYMGALVRTLNDLRLQAELDKDKERASIIKADMLDILLVTFGIATDKEMEEMEHEKRRKEILRECGVLTK